MSNLEKTSRLLQDWADMHSVDMDMYHAARKLLEAGLLAPDLPEPDKHDEETPYWYAGSYGIRVGRLTKRSPMRVMLWDVEPGGVLNTDIESAREYALKVLAACEYAEKEQGNEF